MANVNARYSQDTPPKDRGKQILGPNDGNCFDAYSPVEEVQCAHDLQGAPDSLYSSPLANNATGAGSVETVDRQSDPDFTRISKPDVVLVDHPTVFGA